MQRRSTSQSKPPIAPSSKLTVKVDVGEEKTLVAKNSSAVAPKDVGLSSKSSIFAKMKGSALAKMAERKASSNPDGALNFALQSGRKIDLDVFSASRTGSLQLLKQLVASGQPIDPVDDGLRSPLHYSSAGGYTDCVQFLLSSKASVCTASRDNEWTCLHEAANGEIAEMLINAKANVNASDAWGMTPLHLASRRGNAEVALCLIEYRADLNATDDLGRTPLHIGAHYGHEGVVQELASRGANLDARDSHGRAPRELAMAMGHREVVSCLDEMMRLLGEMGSGGNSLRSLPAGSPARLTRGANQQPSARPRTPSNAGI